MSDLLVSADQFHNLFMHDIPFLDVRSEDEFSKGSLPNSFNLPILNNHERRLVGICYKQKGQQAALQLGHNLVCGELKQNRIQHWRDFVTNNPDTHIFCWRGGMRSHLARQWINETGIAVPLIVGGYKALRRYLMQAIDEATINLSMIRIGGKTGVAKTLLINEIAASIDLEKHAMHRGSSFGDTVNQQPTQSDFEHTLAIDLLRMTYATPSKNTLFVEDESRNIGTIAIPETLFKTMRRSPLALIEMPLESRISRILQEYITDMLTAFQMKHNEHGFEYFSAYLHSSLFRIQKRLGSERYKYIHNLMTKALTDQLNTGNIHNHEAWISHLLAEYYDPMYAYQIMKNKESVIFSGNYKEVLEWANNFNTPLRQTL
ncbi:tRNA 2-selenouridine(34) synthase MnmH [Nitrosomonas sp.]|uniref:tRNA 2-selenouridine(34) synthase MnmH n=1 Tax=Nitrosomonas sp. TaxID=42353 RepID=UPI0025F68573|nr:tRNA 2-selenouridine(34) synthase MnmH [Nitrosomonas sp.]MBY0484989.1 tRNA 2-selenouridine(34) synthase MnmH [Nitrosomonas sp.]